VVYGVHANIGIFREEVAVEALQTVAVAVVVFAVGDGRYTAAI